MNPLATFLGYISQARLKLDAIQTIYKRKAEAATGSSSNVSVGVCSSGKIRDAKLDRRRVDYIFFRICPFC